MKRIGIREICWYVAEVWHGDDTSKTTIRCAINDARDAFEKDGCRVSHDFNPSRAVATVRRLIKERKV